MATVNYKLTKDEVIEIFIKMVSDDELPEDVAELLIDLLSTVSDDKLTDLLSKWVVDSDMCIDDFVEIEEDQSIEIVSSPKAPAKKKAKK